MRILARIFVAAALAGSLGLPSFAQTESPSTTTSTSPTTSNGRRGGNSEHKLQKLASRLGLSQDQVSKLRQIYKSTPKGKQRRQAMMAVLTPEQLATLKASHKGRKGGTSPNP